MPKYNIKEFKELRDKYKSLTLEQLESGFETGYPQGKYVLRDITGFSLTNKCILCRAAGIESIVDSCHKCMWSIENGDTEAPCYNKSYEAITTARNAEELHEAIKSRIRDMNRVIKIYEKKYGLH